MTNRASLPVREDGWARKKWSVSECRALTASGLLDAGSYELIEGEIVFKMSQDQARIITITCIVAALAAIFGNLSLIHQANIGIGELDEFNDPEPDIAVVRGTVRDYLNRRPDPATDILLLVLFVEAANSTLRGDTTVKANLRLDLVAMQVRRLRREGEQTIGVLLLYVHHIRDKNGLQVASGDLEVCSTSGSMVPSGRCTTLSSRLPFLLTLSTRVWITQLTGRE